MAGSTPAARNRLLVLQFPQGGTPYTPMKMILAFILYITLLLGFPFLIAKAVAFSIWLGILSLIVYAILLANVNPMFRRIARWGEK